MDKILFDNFANDMTNGDMNFLNTRRIIGRDYNPYVYTIFHHATVIAHQSNCFSAYLSSEIECANNIFRITAGANSNYGVIRIGQCFDLP